MDHQSCGLWMWSHSRWDKIPYLVVQVKEKLANTHIRWQDLYSQYWQADTVDDSNIMDAKKSAKLCAINILAQLEKNLGNLERVEKIIRINGFVNSQPDFTAHPKVIDAASDLMYSVFGDKGKHSRIAIGVQSLPLNSMTEIDALVQIC